MDELQALLKDNHISYYIVPTSDDHMSEYVGDYYKLREYLSGFTGSAGTLLVGQEEAYLWTDGRYFLQASMQLPPTIQLMKQGIDISLLEFLEKYTDKNDVIAFDGKVLSANTFIELENTLDATLLSIDYSYIFKNRPERSHTKVIIYDKQYHGLSTRKKLFEIREFMHLNECKYHLISSLDDICWILNIRGHDISYSPMILSFLLITDSTAYLYIQEESLTDEFIKYCEKNTIIIKEYQDIYDDMTEIEDPILVDLNTINTDLYNCMNWYVDVENISTYLKAIKNPTEITNIKRAHHKDGVALVKFMYWLRHDTLNNQTEVSISDKLESFRKQQENYIEPSFHTICGYESNGAIIHYEADEVHPVPVYKKGLLLIDSGAQYLEGTTDVTRTFVLGEITENQKRDFTLVLKGFLHLMDAVFPDGTTGSQLDTFARSALWKELKDYRHGTGHGVGHFLNCHEGPQSIRPKNSETTLLPGMIISNEPGYYKDNDYGIRHENLLLCISIDSSEYGDFYGFESLTLCPIDKEGIDISLLTHEEISILNHYHSYVYESLKNDLTEEERIWLKERTCEL